jgi:hypothetical protein
MYDIAVRILRFVDGSFPGWVESELVDANGRRHIFIEKVPVVTLEDSRADSECPVPGIIRCEILRKYSDENGRELVCVSTAKPWSIESTEGLSEFTIPVGLVTPVPD